MNVISNLFSLIFVTEDVLENDQIVKPKKKRGRRKKNPEITEAIEVFN